MTSSEPGIRVALTACGAGWEADALAEIERTPHLHLVRRCVDIADLLASAETHRFDAALVAPDAAGLDAEVAHRLESAGVTTFLVGGAAGDRGVSRTVQLGGLGLLDLGDLRDRVAATRPESTQGTLLVVWGPTGAPGRSTLAVSLATAAAAQGLTTAVVDADVHGGSVAQLLGILDEVSGVMAACRDAARGHPETADDHLLAVGERLHVLTGVQRADMWHHLRPHGLEAVIQRLLATHDLVVVDTAFGVDPGTGSGPWRDQVTCRLLELADEVVAVGRVDPVGLARLVRAVADAGPWKRPPRIVLNGFRASLGWSEREVSATVRELTGVSPWACLPFEGAAHDAALMRGRSVREVSPTSGYAARVDRLIADLPLRAEVPTA